MAKFSLQSMNFTLLLVNSAFVLFFCNLLVFFIIIKLVDFLFEWLIMLQSLFFLLGQIFDILFTIFFVMFPFYFFLLKILQLFLKKIDRLLQFYLFVCVFLREILELLFTHHDRFLSTVVLFLFIEEVLCWTFSIEKDICLLKVILFIQSLVKGVSIKIDTDVYHFFLLFSLFYRHFISLAPFEQGRVIKD